MLRSSDSAFIRHSDQRSRLARRLLLPVHAHIVEGEPLHDRNRAVRRTAVHREGFRCTALHLRLLFRIRHHWSSPARIG